MTKSDLVRVVHDFSASTEAVYESWMTPQAWESWLGPPGVRCEISHMDPVQFGLYRLVMHAPQGDIVVAGQYREVKRPHRLVFTWGAEGDPSRQSVVTVTVEPLGAGARLILEQTGIADPSEQQSHLDGWRGALGKLQAGLELRT